MEMDLNLNLDLPLEHGRVHLRAIQEADLPHWLNYLQKDPVRQGISWRPQGTQDLAEFVNSTDVHRAGAQVRFAIARMADDTLLGTVGLHSISIPHRSAEVAYDLQPDAWGQGFATAACRAVVAWAMAQGLYRIQATVLVGNRASVRVLERSGFELEGRLRGCRWVEGAARDALIYSCLKA